MYISRSFIVALLSGPFLAFAQSSANPFNNPMGGYNVVAGQPLTLSWKPTTDGTVSLVLRSGNSGDLDEGTTFASSIPNSGSYTWQVPADTPRGSSYTIEIVDDSNPDATNYTPQFVLESTNNSPSSASSSGMSMTMSTATSASATVSDSMTSSSASMSMSMSMSSDSSSSASMTMTGSSTESTMMTSTMSDSSSSESSSSTTSGDSDLVASQTASSTQSDNGAAKATAMAGMLGMVALGALAL